MLFDKMHPMARLGLIAAIFFVLFSFGGIAAEGQLTDSGYSGQNLIQQVSLPAGIALPPGLEAKAFNSSFALGSVFFGPDGTAYVFSQDRDTQKLIAIDSNGAARTYAESELLSGLSLKTGVPLGSSILMTVDFWPEGGSPFDGIFLLNPDGSYRKWNLTNGNYAGLSRIIPAPDGGWYFSDFERDNIWYLSAEGASETPMIAKGDVPPGLGDLAYDGSDGVLYAMNWVGGWPFGGIFAVYKITNDGEAELFARVNETSDMNGAMALSTSGPFGHALYVSDAAGGKVLKVEADGTTVPIITDLIKPGYMKFNPVNGDLLIVCDDGPSLIWLGSDLSRVGSGSSPEIEASPQETATPSQDESEAQSDMSKTDMSKKKADNIKSDSNWNQDSVESSPLANAGSEYGQSGIEGHTVSGATKVQEHRNGAPIQTVREYDRDGKLLWEIEGYRHEGYQDYKVLNRGSPSLNDPDGFILSFLSGLVPESNAEKDGTPICIIHDGYELVPHGKIKSWITFSGIFEIPVVEGEYDNGLKQGRWAYWSYPEMFGRAAVKAGEGEYLDGQREGHWIYYDKSCKNMISEEGDYLNGVKQESTWIKNEYVVDLQGKCVPGKSDSSAIGHLTE